MSDQARRGNLATVAMHRSDACRCHSHLGNGCGGNTLYKIDWRVMMFEEKLREFVTSMEELLEQTSGASVAKTGQDTASTRIQPVLLAKGYMAQLEEYLDFFILQYEAGKMSPFFVEGILADLSLYDEMYKRVKSFVERCDPTATYSDLSADDMTFVQEISGCYRSVSKAFEANKFFFAEM